MNESMNTERYCEWIDDCEQDTSGQKTEGFTGLWSKNTHLKSWRTPSVSWLWTLTMVSSSSQSHAKRMKMSSLPSQAKYQNYASGWHRAIRASNCLADLWTFCWKWQQRMRCSAKDNAWCPTLNSWKLQTRKQSDERLHADWRNTMKTQKQEKRMNLGHKNSEYEEKFADFNQIIETHDAPSNNFDQDEHFKSRQIDLT